MSWLPLGRQIKPSPPAFLDKFLILHQKSADLSLAFREK